MEVEHGFIVGAILGVAAGFGLGWGFGRLSLRDELRRECAEKPMTGRQARLLVSLRHKAGLMPLNPGPLTIDEASAEIDRLLIETKFPVRRS